MKNKTVPGSRAAGVLAGRLDVFIDEEGLDVLEGIENDYRFLNGGDDDAEVWRDEMQEV